MDYTGKEERVREAVLEAMYDLTVETRKQKPNEIPAPTLGEVARRADVEVGEASYVLEDLIANRLVVSEESDGGDGPSYSITKGGMKQIESKPRVVEIPLYRQHQSLVRDMELIRVLVAYIADNAREHQLIPQPQVAEYSDELVSYHLSIMHEAGLINGERMGSGKWGLGPLTWEGQEFLSAASDDQAWAKARKSAGGNFATLTLSIVKDLVVRELRNQLGLPT